MSLSDPISQFILVCLFLIVVGNVASAFQAIASYRRSKAMRERVEKQAAAK